MVAEVAVGVVVVSILPVVGLVEGAEEQALAAWELLVARGPVRSLSVTS